MTPLFLLFVVSGLELSDAHTPHIKAAAAAYQASKAAMLRKQPAAAAELLRKAIDIEPTYLNAYKNLIDALAASGDRLAAAAVITRLIEIEPAAQQYRLQLARILLSEKQWGRSLAQFSFILRDDPFNADALWGFAIAAKMLGMQSRASDALAKGRVRYPLDKRFSTP